MKVPIVIKSPEEIVKSIDGGIVDVIEGQIELLNEDEESDAG